LSCTSRHTLHTGTLEQLIAGTWQVEELLPV
jgi:hypothetical protein